MRKNLDFELSPEEKRERFVTIGDFTKLNNKINKQRSETTYQEMTQNLTILHEPILSILSSTYALLRV